MGTVAEAALPARDEHARVWRRLFVLVGAVLALSYGYFFSGGGWNQASRFDLVRAIVEQGTIRIDRYHENTGDKAERDGHYYCDKAPGVSFMAVPAVAAARPLLKLLGVRTRSNRGLVWLAFVGTFAASGLPTAAGALALMWLARRFGAKPLPAALAAVAVGVGTPTFAYAVLLWGHATAGACLMGALAAGVAALDAVAPRRAWALSALFGFLLALAVTVEYPAGAAGALVGASVLLRAYQLRKWPGVARLVGGVALGAAAPLALLLAYQNAAFGSPFALSYSKVEGWEGMQQGFFGVTAPRPAVLAELLAGAQRGVAWLAPCLLVAPIGLVVAWKRRGESRWLAVAALGVVVFYFLLNASYHYWDGGFTYGPRHVGPALPFLALGVAFAASASRRLLVVSLVLTALSALMTLPVLAVNPMPPTELRLAHVNYALPELFAGHLGQNAIEYFGKRPVPNFNLGEAAGLHGMASLLPLLAVWIAAVVVAARTLSASAECLAATELPVPTTAP